LALQLQTNNIKNFSRRDANNYNSHHKINLQTSETKLQNMEIIIHTNIERPQNKSPFVFITAVYLMLLSVTLAREQQVTANNKLSRM